MHLVGNAFINRSPDASGSPLDRGENKWRRQRRNLGKSVETYCRSVRFQYLRDRLIWIVVVNGLPGT